MLVLDNGDAIRGIAEVATKLDFIVNGYVGTTATQLADGQLGSGEADLYQSGANATVVTSITVVNTDSAAITFTLYLKPSGGTSRAISPVSLDLGIGHSFYTDGQRMVVMDKEGKVLSTTTVLAHALGGGSHDADTLSNLNSKISDATLVDTGGIILQSLLTTQNDIVLRGASIAERLNIGASRIVARLASGNVVAATVAQILTLIGVASGADVTGSNPPQAHKNRHDPIDGSDKLDSAAPVKVGSANAIGSSHSFSRADHVHEREHTKYLDAAAIAAVEAAGLTFIENKGIILDPSLSADGKWSGIIEAGIAGEELEFGEVVYQVAGDGEWELAQAIDAAHSDGKIGICVEYASGATQSTTILLFGKVKADTIFPEFSVRRPVYISAATAGLLTTNKPTGTTNFVVRIVGYANTADELFFCPDNTYIELA